MALQNEVLKVIKTVAYKPRGDIKALLCFLSRVGN